MKYFKKIFVLSLLMSASFVNAEIISKMNAYIVKKDSVGNDVLEEAKSVNPGEIIQYEMVFFNDSKENLLDVELSGKINGLTNYIKENTTENKNSKILYSIDNGQSWSEKPLKEIQNENGIIEVEAPISDYTNIKWVFDNFKEKETKTLIYRVKIKDNI